jgi:glycosyltransferase involved in cell wall biosynthesis
MMLFVNQHSEIVKTRPKFSIFTPTFETGRKIERTYQSLKEQTFDDWEWVVVDDSNNEDTWTILQEIAKR